MIDSEVVAGTAGAGPGWNIGGLARTSRILLAILAMLAVAAGGLMILTISTQRTARAHVAHEAEAIVRLHLMLESLLDHETGERGFLLQADPMYLEPLQQAQTDYARTRKAAGQLIERSPYPGESTSLAKLDRLVEAKRKMIADSIALTRSGQHAIAVSAQRSAMGKQAMDAVRREIERLIEQRAGFRGKAMDKARLYESRTAPLFALLGVAVGLLVLLALLIERRQAVTETKALQADALAAANARAELVARELNHRVKNLFAVVLSIISLTGRNRGIDRSAMNELRGRIHALSVAHATSQGQIGADHADLGELISRVLAPYVEEGSPRVSLKGPAVALPARMITPVGMIIHELATNAAKYGAFSTPEGALSISWEVVDGPDAQRIVRLDWIETGGPALEQQASDPVKGGFGATMIELSARQLEGRLDRIFTKTGAQIALEFPLAD